MPGRRRDTSKLGVHPRYSSTKDIAAASPPSALPLASKASGVDEAPPVCAISSLYVTT